MKEVKNKKLWFKAKTYGYGWTPCSWQGWAVILLYATSCLTIFIQIDNDKYSVFQTLIDFILPFLSLSFFLIVICIFRGEKAGWRWGNKSETKN